MALKTLSTFLTPLSLPNPKFLQIHTKPCLILCEFSRPSKSRLPEGTGAAAPSPGEKFLEHQKSFEATKLIPKQNNSKKKEKPLKTSIAVASCYGCGAPLQTSDNDAPGFVHSETYELVGISIIHYKLVWLHWIMSFSNYYVSVSVSVLRRWLLSYVAHF